MCMQYVIHIIVNMCVTQCIKYVPMMGVCAPLKVLCVLQYIWG